MFKNRLTYPIIGIIVNTIDDNLKSYKLLVILRKNGKSIYFILINELFYVSSFAKWLQIYAT